MIPLRASRKHWRVCAALILVVAIFLASCSSTAPNLPALPGISPPSEDEESRISREFRREARKHLKFVNHPEVERYVDRIGRRILGATGPQAFDYRFFVVEDNQLNAFAVPGGSIYLFSGLIERAKTTDELAGVLGHEIVHVKARHMARSSGPDAISVLSLLGMVLLARSGDGAQAAGMVGQAVAATRQAAYSRQLEMEADTLGARYMTSAGYDPKGAVAFLKTLDQERALNPVDVPAYIMSHPVTQERVANAELVIRSLGPSQLKPASSESLKKIQMIIRMDRPDRQGIVAEMEKSVRQNPDNPEQRHLLGFAQQLQGNLAEAQRNFEEARKAQPDNPALQRDLGRLYGQTGDFVNARQAFDRALALEPNEPLTYLYLGEMLETSGDLKSAVGAYLNAHNLAPLWERPPQKLGMVYGKLDRRGDGYYYLARAHALQDDDVRAIADYERAIKIIGDSSPRGQLIREELKILRNRRR
jgi:beta-barrel assembly-enhancing protease